MRLRYFGKCPVKGCRRHVAVEAGSPGVQKHSGINGDILVIQDRAGRISYLAQDGIPAVETAKRIHGYVCPDHARAFRFTPGQFKLDPSKPCSPKCEGATGLACSCSCGGENHGGRWVR